MSTYTINFSVTVKEVHDAEILTMDFSSPSTNTRPDDADKSKTSGPTLLATASRDRLVHVFDAAKVFSRTLRTLANIYTRIMI